MTKAISDERQPSLSSMIAVYIAILDDRLELLLAFSSCAMAVGEWLVA